MGRKAEDTVSVVMWAEPIYKNEVITESMLEEYKMLKGEFEKYAVEKSDGTKKRRIVLWDERDKLINTFATYPLQRDTVAEEIEFGEHTQGCSNDLEKVTKTIHETITADGFNEESLLNQNVLMENGLQYGVNDEIIRVCNNKLFEYNEQTMFISTTDLQ